MQLETLTLGLDAFKQDFLRGAKQKFRDTVKRREEEPRI